MVMSSVWHCSKCGGNFSEKGYQDHLPCHGSEVIGGSGQYAKEGTGRPKSQP